MEGLSVLMIILLLIFGFGCYFVGSQTSKGSGARNVFNNEGTGPDASQDISNATIRAGAEGSGSSDQLSGVDNAFNNKGGKQTLRDVEIIAGARCSGSSSQLSGTQYVVGFPVSKITNRQGEKKD